MLTAARGLRREAPAWATAHIATQEQLDGKAFEWMQKVPDERYNGK
jgi:hypothetical protein